MKLTRVIANKETVQWIDSQYGRVTLRDWLVHESRRIRAGGGYADVVGNVKDGWWIEVGGTIQRDLDMEPTYVDYPPREAEATIRFRKLNHGGMKPYLRHKEMPLNAKPWQDPHGVLREKELLARYGTCANCGAEV